MIAPFGHHGSVTPAALEALPAAMQREGILLLMEMGLSVATVAKALGRSQRAVSDMVRFGVVPIRCACFNADVGGE